MKELKQNFCTDCELPKSSHYANWAQEIFSLFIPNSPKYGLFDRLAEKYLDRILIKVFGFFKLAEWQDDFDIQILQPRSQSFVAEARKNSCIISIIKTKLGYTNHLRLIKNDKILYFDGLPTPQFLQKTPSFVFDDKKKGKKLLAQNNFPILAGKAFWFWQKKQALKFAGKLGYPLVVKPRRGSVARHVTTNIQNFDELKNAIKKSLEYSPTFLVEKYFNDGFVHRVTIIDAEHIFVARQEPANITGDGIYNIHELIEQKNSQPQRQGNFYHPLVFDKNSKNILQSKNLDENSILQKDKKIYLQKDPFLRLGGDFFDVTDQTNPQNIEMFRNIAKTFDIKIFGLDFMSQDISIPWDQNHGAILEINSLPCLEIHEQAIDSKEKNLGHYIYQLFKKYYL